ncbi:MAG TPA: DUF3108 domain-containing protein [Terriglobales bacterium]|nr:DUF3108 domain-containing protein [Terriglobales bacterium]
MFSSLGMTGTVAQNPAPQPSLPVATAAPAVRIVPPPVGYKFPNGQYNYQVEWRLFDAGIASFKMETAGREQRIIATADAKGVVGLLYHVHDRFESFFDPVTACSRAIEKKTEEGFRRLETSIVFDSTRKKSLLAEKNLRNNQTKHVENDIPGCVTDVVTAVFYIGTLSMAPNAIHYFPLNDGGKTVDVRLSVEAREEVKTPAGTYKTVKVLATGTTGAAKDKGQIWIWYTDDPRRMPVQMKAKLLWGTLTFRMR